MKKSRAAGFAAITAGYIIAAAVGIVVFRLLEKSVPPVLGFFIADIAATVAIYIMSLITDNASFYDPYWSVQPIVILPLAAAYFRSPGCAVIIAVVAFWAVRLTANWAYTFMGLSFMDWRYQQIKEKTKKLYPLVNFAGIQMVPTLIVFACILPAIKFFELHAAFDPKMLIGAAICVFAAVLQLISDIQMHTYRKNRTTPFISTGLWKYSRHPNYLGEILMWWGLYICVVLAEPSLWIYGFGALANTLMFLFISIPLADGRQSRKEGFAEYKKRTRMLLPIKKKA